MVKHVCSIFFVSRNKDNKDIPNFKERKMSFVVNDNYEYYKLMRKFYDFVNKGFVGELSRFYISVNKRDDAKVRKTLLHYLIDHPELDLSKIESKIASIASKTENRAESKWLIDIDTIDKSLVSNFFKDLPKYIDQDLISIPTQSINGWHVVVNHGFDARELMEKYGEVVDIKRDDMELVVYDKKRLFRNSLIYCRN